MATYNVSSKDFAKVFRKNEGNRRRAVLGAVAEAAASGVVIVEETISEKKIRDVGDLAGSVHVERTPGGRQVVVDAPHAGIVEMGSRPHVPPEQPIRDWVMRHLAGFQVKPVRAQRLSVTVPTEAQQRRRDAAIARHRARVDAYKRQVAEIVAAIRFKIGREGTRPHWFMKESIPKMRARLQSLVERRMRDGEQWTGIGSE